jgi:hypothetical protein
MLLCKEECRILKNTPIVNLTQDHNDLCMREEIMKSLILVLMMCLSTKAFAVTVTKTGSGATTWLSTTSCWSACYNAKNRAVAKINATAAKQCVQGYTITAAPTCTWPQRDPSRIVSTKYWYDCSCNVSCTASYTCNNNAKFPNFFLANVNKDKEVYMTNMRRAKEVAAVKGELAYMNDPETVYEYMLQDSQDGLVNAKQALHDLASGKVNKLVPPSAVGLVKELDHYGTEADKDCDKTKIDYVKPIKPVLINKPIRINFNALGRNIQEPNLMQ